MTTIARKFIVRDDELDGTEDEPATVVHPSRAPRPRPDWIVVAPHGAIGCCRCGASRPLVPKRDEPIDVFVRDLRAFAKSHGDCKARST